MIIIYFIFIFLASYYSYLILQIYIGWIKTPNVDAINSSTLGVSVIIAARNEENYINDCIQSILDNVYPQNLIEILIINDHSTDNTALQVNKFKNDNIRLLNQKDNIYGKKAALNFGVSQAKFPIILSTDADCLVDKKWIQSHVSLYHDQNTKFGTGIVLPQTDDTILSKFQWFDFAATMAITANGIYRKNYFLANGANLSYQKETFAQVKGFEHNDNLASGDDVFLANKIANRYPKSIIFLKSKGAIVHTKSEADWSSFFAQRKRWATKSMQSGNGKVIQIQSFVFVYSLILVIGLLLATTLYHQFWPVVILALTIKMLTDFLFLNQLAKYFDKKEVMKAFIPSFFIYFGHIILSGYFALFPSYYLWKERKTK